MGSGEPRILMVCFHQGIVHPRKPQGKLSQRVPEKNGLKAVLAVALLRTGVVSGPSTQHESVGVPGQLVN
jgi:hypothetical protein